MADLLKQILDRSPIRLNIFKASMNTFSFHNQNFRHHFKSTIDQIHQLNQLKNHTHQRQLPSLSDIILNYSLPSRSDLQRSSSKNLGC